MTEANETARQRLSQVFGFLKALNEHRNPAVRQIREQPWSLWLDDLPEHSAIQRGVVTEDQSDEDADEQLDDSFVLRVRRPKLTSPPSPPADLKPWLLSGWDNPENEEVRVHESKNEVDESDETTIIEFDDDISRVELLDDWSALREEWRINEIPARRAMTVFERLYELHGRIDREAERLDFVLGDGILSWRREDGGVYHPVLLQRVQLVFDPGIPEFTVVDSDYGVELYTGLFQAFSDVDGQDLARCRQECEQGDYHPLAEQSSGFLKRFALALSSKGEAQDEGRPGPESEAPLIGRSPVLFLRMRTQGFNTAIETVIDSIKDRDEFPPGLTNVVGVESPPEWDDESGQPSVSARNSASPDENILFGKEANAEQIRIAQRLNKYGAVLVQGPPGTGKSHTIGNLIGHLLAQKKSVLVTSHTTKALRVLRNHVVEELRPLCVSVLESDLDSRRQLEEAVQGISNRLSDSDADLLDHEADQFATTRSQLIERLDSLHSEMLNARSSEYRDVVLAGKSWHPSQAARLIATGRDTDDWIPGPVAADCPLPLSHSELVELYSTNEGTTREDDRLVEKTLPDVEELLSPAEFEETVTQSEELSDQSTEFDQRYWKSARFTAQNIRQLESLYARFEQSLRKFKEAEQWKLAAIEAGRTGDASRTVWDRLVSHTHTTESVVADAQLDLINFSPEVSTNENLDEQQKIAQEIWTYLATANGLSWMKRTLNPRWNKALQAWSVQGSRPTSAEHFRAVDYQLRIEIARRDLCRLWDGLMHGGGVPLSPEFGPQPEQVCSQFSGAINEALDWWKNVVDALTDELQSFGFDWEGFLNQQPLQVGQYAAMRRTMDAIEQALLPSLNATICRLRATVLRSRLRKSANDLAQYDRPETESLRHAIADSDAEHYQAAWTVLTAAVERRSLSVRRRELLARLEGNPKSHSIAPAWAAAIRRRDGVHGEPGLPGDPDAAWQWRQLNDELDRRQQLDIDELGAQIEDLQRQLAELTIDLIDRRAWSGQVRRTTLTQRQALMGWLDTVRRIGRGYGKRAPRLRLEARRKMGECRSAVPVWIMPLSRIAENFDFHEPQFDVAIIDEASQCDVMALLAFAIARQVVVVGDHEQVSPSAVGQNLDIVENLIKLHLQGIPNSHLYDGRMSVYDLARQSFGGTICLAEHFRCVPDIIQFSNYLSYEGRIKPLRDESTAPITPFVIPYRVEAHSRDGKVNHQEAEVVASLVVAIVESAEYQGQSIGVISLVGDDQALEIERLLRQQLSPEQFDARRIICGNSAQFQGDERDIVFLSMVDTPKGTPLRLRQQPAFQQRFNVAASRARNQMWVIYSLNPDIDLKPADLRRRLIEHALDPKAITRELDAAESKTESEFERQVLTRLIARRFQVTPQWKVGRYRIDLVVEGDGKRLAIECDGDRFHPIEKLPEDMARQAVLERLGWRFVRIRGSRFFRDPDAAMAPVFQRLEQLGIEPLPETLDEEPLDAAEDIIEKLKRRAAALRAEWNADDDDDSPDVDEESGESGDSREARRDVMPDQVDEESGDAEIVFEEAVSTESDANNQLNLFEPELPSEDADSGIVDQHEEHTRENDELTESRELVEQTVSQSGVEDGPETATNDDSEPVHTSQSAGRTYEVESVSADEWFTMAHWAKENGQLTPWERKFCFSQGIRVNKDNPPSEKQAEICRKILQTLCEAGFSSTESDRPNRPR